MEIYDALIHELSAQGLNTEDFLNQKGEIVFGVKNTVSEYLNITNDQAISNIKQVLKNDYKIEGSEVLTYLSPKEFRERYIGNPLIHQSYFQLFGKNIPALSESKDSFKVKEYNKNFKKIKELLKLPKENERYFHNQLKSLLKQAGVECIFSLEQIGLLELGRKFKGNFLFRICLKKLFGKSRISDLSRNKIITTLGLTNLPISKYKDIGKRDLLTHFKSYELYASYLNNSHNLIFAEDKEIFQKSIGLRYFFLNVLGKNKIHALKTRECKQAVKWCNFIPPQIESLSEIDIIKQCLETIGITDPYILYEFSMQEIENKFTNNVKFKSAFKSITGSYLHDGTFIDILTLGQVLFPTDLETENIKNKGKICIKKLGLQSANDIKEHFSSDHKRRKFIYLKENSVFIYIFKRVLHPEFLDKKRGWDQSKITENDIENFCLYLGYK